MLEAKFDAPLQSKPGGRGGKYERVIKLVHIWKKMKEFPEIVDHVNSQRATRLSAAMIHVKEYVDVMEHIENVSEENVSNETQRFLSFKVEQMTADEFARKWKSQGSDILSPQEYPVCPHPDCAHHLIDGPPSNLDADTINQANTRGYIASSRAYELWKKKQGPQPIDDKTGELMNKPPKPPTKAEKYLRCHCSQVSFGFSALFLLLFVTLNIILEQSQPTHRATMYCRMQLQRGPIQSWFMSLVYVQLQGFYQTQ